MREGRNQIHNNSITYKVCVVKRIEHKKRNLKLNAWVTNKATHNKSPFSSERTEMP